MISNPREFVSDIGPYTSNPELFTVTASFDDFGWNRPWVQSDNYYPPNPEMYGSFIEALNREYDTVMIPAMDCLFAGWPNNHLERWISNNHIGVRLTFDVFYNNMMDMRVYIQVRARGIPAPGIDDYAEQYAQAYVMNKLESE